MPLQGQAVGIGAKFHDLGEVQYICSDRFAQASNRPTRKPAWPIQWMLWRVNRNEAEMLE